MRGIRAQAIFRDDDLEVGMISTKLSDEALGGVALAIIFLAAIRFDNGLGHQGNDFAPLGVDEGRTQHLMGIGHGTVSVVFFQARVAMNLLGGKIAGAIEGYKIVALDKDHLFKGVATLKVAISYFERRSQAFGLDRIEDLAHRCITR